MFEQMAPKKSGGKNKNMCVRLESSECHLFFIPYPHWDPGPGADGFGSVCTLGQKQQPNGNI